MLLKIGDWVADDQTDTLRRDGVVRKVERRAMAVLVHLAQRRGEVVSKDGLIEAVWGPVAISDHSVAIVISQLRRALGDDRTAPSYIETIPKRGYRLIAAVGDAAETPASMAAESAPGPRRRFPVNPRLAGVIAAVAALFVAAPLAMQQRDPIRTLAVADFSNDTGSAEKDYIAFAMPELVSGRLVESSGARIVRLRKGQPKNGNDVILLTGRLLRDGEGDLIAVQLSAPATGEVLRGNIYRLDERTFVTAAAEIARDAASVAGRIVPHAGEASSDAQPAEAFALYWRARYAASVREHDSLRRARDLLITLVRDYPEFAAGHAALADIYAHKTGEHLGLPRLDTFAEAERHLEEARRLGGETSETAVTAALLSFYRDRDPHTALAHARQACDLAPGNPLAWQTRGMVASAGGKDRDALHAIERARALDPSAPSILWDRVWFLYIAGRSAEALDAARQASKVSPPIHIYLALIHEALGRPREAWSAWLDRAGQRGVDIGALRDREGSAADYQALLATMRAGAGGSDSGVPLALLRLRAGDRSGAIDAIVASGPPRDNWMMMWARRLGPLAPLRSDPTVAALVSDPKRLPAE